MTHAILACLLALQGESGLTAERSVKLILLDTLGGRREIHRKEVVKVKGSNVSITDLTYGERLVIRPDLKRVWKMDPLRGEYSELAFDDIAAVRKRAFDEIRAAKARVPGTADERELDALLEGFDQFAAEPKIETRASDGRVEVVLNGDRVRLSAQLDPQRRAPGWFEALSAIGAFHPAMASKLGGLDGFPMKGTLRYVLFLERVVEQFEVTSARSGEIPDSEFAPPTAGLKKVPLRGFDPAPERRPAKPAQFRNDFKEDEIDRQNNPLQQTEKKDKP